MRRLFFSSVLLVAVITTASITVQPAPVWAHDPPKELVCSPGYYKNHTEVWLGTCGDDRDLCNLKPQCSGTSPLIRNSTAAKIEACLKYIPCKD